MQEVLLPPNHPFCNLHLGSTKGSCRRLFSSPEKDGDVDKGDQTMPKKSRISSPTALPPVGTAAPRPRFLVLPPQTPVNPATSFQQQQTIRFASLQPGTGGAFFIVHQRGCNELTGDDAMDLTKKPPEGDSKHEDSDKENESKDKSERPFCVPTSGFAAPSFGRIGMLGYGSLPVAGAPWYSGMPLAGSAPPPFVSYIGNYGNYIAPPSKAPGASDVSEK